jgi:Gas vesicle synthesis protein GvpL/GvpF
VLDLAGLPEPEIRLVTHRGLGLVVADVELDPFAALDTDPSSVTDAPDENDPLVVLARRHDDVVRAVFEREPVLPLRFGTILRDRPAAARLLADRHELANAELDRLAGHREWGVRARFAQPSAPAARPRDDLSGTEYLAMRRQRLAAAEHDRRRGADAATALHDALAGWATEVADRTPRSPALLLDSAYLVPAAREPAFHTEIERQLGAADVAVEVTGPWPPYSFARLELPAGGPAGVVAHA